MKKILSVINELEKQIHDEGQMKLVIKLKETLKKYAEDNDELWEPDSKLTERIDAGIGFIDWNSNNLQLQGVMEELENVLKKKSATEIENILRAL